MEEVSSRKIGYKSTGVTVVCAAPAWSALRLPGLRGT